MENDKDFGRYAYFVCRASKFGIVIRPSKKKIVDGEVVNEPGLRVEFNNKMLRVEKTEENAELLEKIRERIKAEEKLDPKRRSFYEEEKPVSMIPESMVAEKLQEKNERIAQLEAENEKLKTTPTKSNVDEILKNSTEKKQ